MNRIYIARHGQNEDNAEGILNGHRDRPLTAKGIEQANELAKQITAAGIIFNCVLTSPLIRAYKTAEVITDTLKIEKPIALDVLIERDFGIMTGKLISDIERLCSPDIIKSGIITYFLSPEGAETFPELLQRGHEILDTVSDMNIDGNILLVCHGDIGKMIYAAFYGISWEEVLTSFHFGNSELLLLEKGLDFSERHVVKLEQHNH